jgi:hypothetical protein
VNKAFWHAGWKVVLGQARLVRPKPTPGEVSVYGTVSIDASFDNLEDGIGHFPSQLAIQSGNQSYIVNTDQNQLPRIAAGAKGKGQLDFLVDSHFNFDDAVLVAGLPTENQAFVPLGKTEGLVSLEPQQVPVTGTAKVNPTTITITSGGLRYDFPSGYTEVRKGHQLLVLGFSATRAAGSESFDVTDLDRANFRLTLPDGSTVGPPSEGIRGAAARYLAPGTTAPDLTVMFEVGSPADGPYTFTYTLSIGSPAVATHASVTFSVPVAGASPPPSTPATVSPSLSPTP